MTTDSSRGAKALTDAARAARALNQVTEEDGAKAGVENHRLFFRAFNDKANLAPPVVASDWFRLASVWLENGPAGGDSVGVEIERLRDRLADPAAGAHVLAPRSTADHERDLVEVGAGDSLVLVERSDEERRPREFE